MKKPVSDEHQGRSFDKSTAAAMKNPVSDDYQERSSEKSAAAATKKTKN